MSEWDKWKKTTLGMPEPGEKKMKLYECPTGPYCTESCLHGFPNHDPVISPCVGCGRETPCPNFPNCIELGDIPGWVEN